MYGTLPTTGTAELHTKREHTGSKSLVLYLLFEWLLFRSCKHLPLALLISTIKLLFLCILIQVYRTIGLQLSLNASMLSEKKIDDIGFLLQLRVLRKFGMDCFILGGVKQKKSNLFWFVLIEIRVTLLQEIYCHLLFLLFHFS